MKCEIIELSTKNILRFKEGSIPFAADEYRSLKKQEKNFREKALKDGMTWNDYVEGIDYNGYKVNLVEYGENREAEYRKGKKKGQHRTIKKGWERRWLYQENREEKTQKNSQGEFMV